jgi:glycosyltransferase involved in cell wall biosynthesis
MKILFYLRIVVMGGAERYLLTLLPELKKRNIEVGFFCTQQNNNKEIIDYFKNHYNQYNIPMYVCKATSPFSLTAAKCLAKTIKKEQYTILSAHLIHAEIISALSKMLFKTSCKLVVTQHGYFQKFMDLHGFDHTKINRLSFSYQLIKFIQYFVTSNVSVSKGVADFYILSGICKQSKIEIIYHGIEPDLCKKVTSPVRYTDNQLLMVARLQKFKGHHFIIEAVKMLCNEIPDLKLVILGKGEEMNTLVNMVNEYKLNDWVIFEGYTDNVFNYINGSDVIVAPSLAEPFGLIVLEAYSCSKPVVAFNVTAFNENVINNETGFLATPYNVEELAQKTKYLLQNKNVAVKFGKNGNKLLEDKFSLNGAVLNTIAFYSKL